eukprot:NODE_1961_length_2323_cov_25.372040.p1 GENE.NODE_1961_length_2323_cov_25.372040~~NODE_1961_length_2323_cov_25.372040.p1  ORF type:complete len:651 (-),score=142.07 NODE_1961_length_2323_cov_25.372040:272-2224(-)
MAAVASAKGASQGHHHGPESWGINAKTDNYSRSLTRSSNTEGNSTICQMQQAQSEAILAEQRLTWSPFRRQVRSLIYAKAFEVFVGIVIVSNIGLVVVDTDREAERLDGSDADDTPTWSLIVNLLYTAFYVIELTARLYVQRKEFFNVLSNDFDFVIIFLDVVTQIIDSAGAQLPSVSILRLFRAVKIVRAVRFLSQYREFYVIISGFTSAMKAVFWASIMISFVLLLWSILAVTTLHPINIDVAREGTYDGCERCPRAYESCWAAFTTFVQTLLAGDSWGVVAIPIMELSPASSIIFLTSLITTQLGIMNLVIGAVVDTIESSRMADFGRILEAKLNGSESSKQELMWLFGTMDTDGDGMLTLEEIQDGYEKNVDFRAMLELMDISKTDLDVVFRILDEDQSSDVNYTEFAEQLHKVKSQDIHTLMVFQKFHIIELRKSVQVQLELMKTIQTETAQVHFSELYTMMRSLSRKNDEAEAIMRTPIKEEETSGASLKDSMVFPADTRKVEATAANGAAPSLQITSEPEGEDIAAAATAGAAATAAMRCTAADALSACRGDALANMSTDLFTMQVIQRLEQMQRNIVDELTMTLRHGSVMRERWQAGGIVNAFAADTKCDVNERGKHQGGATLPDICGNVGEHLMRRVISTL